MENYNLTKEHTFSISAYKESPYLKACVKSLLAQSVKTNIIICTSTPNSYIENIADEFGLNLYIRRGESAIARDWNFAYEKADSRLVTIAHQDDIYSKDYVKTLFLMKKKYPDMGLFNTASAIIKNGELKYFNEAQLIKKLLRLPLRINRLNHISLIKKLAVSFGNPIICPSCTYDKTIYKELYFNPNYKFVLDWDILTELAHKKSRWVCVEKPLIMYRIHTASATRQSIEDNSRMEEESVMFDRLLPYFLSELVKKAYRRSYNAYS